MVGLDRLWAGWRSAYVSAGEPVAGHGCTLCRVLDEADAVVWRGRLTAVILNAYPYTSGHVMALPLRHVSELEDLSGEEASELWGAVGDAVRAVKAAYSPHGLNVGANLGRAAGAGLPTHLHLHVVPRWDGDTNFMTAVAQTRVLPESLDVTGDRLRNAWPS
ncbi:MAG TPA: HIT domain-containing protein [Acidimicrobiales bacterium]|nr:HIT domain-containing protein [Acidimicrobiales bacterium]